MRRWVVLQLAGLDTRPLEPLDEYRKSSQSRQNDDRLHAHSVIVMRIRLDPSQRGRHSPLALIELWLGSPAKESDDVLCHLRGGCGCAISVLDETVVKHTLHRDGSTRKVRVECLCFGNGFASRCISVSSQKSENVVLSECVSAERP